MTSKKPVPTPHPESDKGASSPNRRRLLKAAGVVSAGAFLDHWKKPIVETVVLSAHAQATTPSPTAPTPSP